MSNHVAILEKWIHENDDEVDNDCVEIREQISSDAHDDLPNDINMADESTVFNQKNGTAISELSPMETCLNHHESTPDSQHESTTDSLQVNMTPENPLHFYSAAAKLLLKFTRTPQPSLQPLPQPDRLKLNLLKERNVNDFHMRENWKDIESINTRSSNLSQTTDQGQMNKPNGIDTDISNKCGHKSKRVKQHLKRTIDDSSKGKKRAKTTKSKDKKQRATSENSQILLESNYDVNMPEYPQSDYQFSSGGAAFSQDKTQNQPVKVRDERDRTAAENMCVSQTVGSDPKKISPPSHNSENEINETSPMETCNENSQYPQLNDSSLDSMNTLTKPEVLNSIETDTAANLRLGFGKSLQSKGIGIPFPDCFNKQFRRLEKTQSSLHAPVPTTSYSSEQQTVLQEEIKIISKSSSTTDNNYVIQERVTNGNAGATADTSAESAASATPTTPATSDTPFTSVTLVPPATTNPETDTLSDHYYRLLFDEMVNTVQELVKFIAIWSVNNSQLPLLWSDGLSATHQLNNRNSTRQVTDVTNGTCRSQASNTERIGRQSTRSQTEFHSMGTQTDVPQNKDLHFISNESTVSNKMTKRSVGSSAAAQSNNRNSDRQITDCNSESQDSNNERIACQSTSFQTDFRSIGNQTDVPQIKKNNSKCIAIKKVIKGSQRVMSKKGNSLLKLSLQNARNRRSYSDHDIESTQAISTSSENENQYTTEDFEELQSEDNWLDCVPRKINFDSNKRTNWKTPKRSSTYFRNKYSSK